MAARRRRQFGAARQLPSGRWQASYLGPDGLRRLAPSTFRTKADAHAWLTLRQAEILRGDWTDPDLGLVPLDDFVTRWVSEHRMSERTRAGYERVNRLHIRPYLGNHNLGSIAPDHVRTWRTELVRDGRSEATVAAAYRLLRAVLNTAVDDGRIRSNPCRVKGGDRVRTPERPVATVPQVFALADALPPRYRVFVLAAAFTGLRWGELIALRRRDVEGGRVVVRRAFIEHGGRIVEGPPKSAAGVRVVAMPALLVEELAAHIEAYVGPGPDALLFTGAQGATPKRGSWRSRIDWPAAVRAAGLPAGFHFHDLRHTGNHLAATSGASTRELMHRMGHSSMRAALIYQHATDERSQELAERLDGLLRRERGSG
jgi:integrase